MPYYPVPTAEFRIEYQVQKSRFIVTVSPVFTVEEARSFINKIKAEFSDATHNVPAYILGFGASATSHCSDNGEPTGTAGRPALAVLSGSGFGDIAVVVTRYFGGIKLGKGGLVRAYTESVQLAIEAIPRGYRVPTHTLIIGTPYNWYERLKTLLESHQGQILEQVFTANVTITARIPIDTYQAFQSALTEASHGSLESLVIDTAEVIVPLN
jgi:uncharacterized YigZ family protein